MERQSIATSISLTKQNFRVHHSLEDAIVFRKDFSALMITRAELMVIRLTLTKYFSLSLDISHLS